MHIQALSSVVLDVSESSISPSDSISVISLETSHHSSDTNVEVLAKLVGKSEVSLTPGSDGVSSAIEDKPLFVITWEVVSDSESELVASNVLTHVKGSVGVHS